jgi:hypothetical protein
MVLNKNFEPSKKDADGYLKAVQKVLGYINLTKEQLDSSDK